MHGETLKLNIMFVFVSL